MSSSAVPQCPNMSSLRELLAAEKVEAKLWLRAEMDRFVDPLVDSLFHRLETKLTNAVGQNQFADGDDRAQVVNSSVAHQLVTSIFPPSTLSRLDHQNVISNCAQSNLLYLYSPGQSPVLPLPEPITNAQITLPNELANVKSRPMQIKHEIKAIANEPMAEGQFLNEQSNQNLTNLNDEKEYDEYGVEITDEEDDDDSDSVQWIEDDQELSRPAKKPRMNSFSIQVGTQPVNAQPEVIGEPSRQATVEAQPMINQDKQYITLRLQCPQSDCLQMFAEHELIGHLKTKHLIDPFRCVVKDCGHSFSCKVFLGDHIKQVHQHTAQLHCVKCAKHFKSYNKLSQHNIQHHQLGQFQCSFPSCTFTGECRGKMYGHYKQTHKPLLNCRYFGCNYRTHKSDNLKVHERTHSGFKPFLCKWPSCDHASAHQSDTIRHIRRHFECNPGSVPNGDQFDPKDYLEVVYELLSMNI